MLPRLAAGIWRGHRPSVIYLPGQRQAQPGWLEARACPGKRGGGVLVPGVIKPGTGIPFYDA